MEVSGGTRGLCEWARFTIFASAKLRQRLHGAYSTYPRARPVSRSQVFRVGLSVIVGLIRVAGLGSAALDVPKGSSTPGRLFQSARQKLTQASSGPTICFLNLYRLCQPARFNAHRIACRSADLALNITGVHGASGGDIALDAVRLEFGEAGLAAIWLAG